MEEGNPGVSRRIQAWLATLALLINESQLPV
jgi:hypothetical protein